MTKKVENRNQPTWIVWVAAAALLFASWRVVTLGAADNLAERDPAAALGWRSAHPTALLNLAGQTGQEAADKERLARRALRADPLNGRGYRLLGEAAAASSNNGRALEMYLLAAERSPRDVRAQGWLVDHHLKSGDVETALAHLDPLLRVDPDLVEAVMPMLTQLAHVPQAQPALAARLQMRPPWRLHVVTGLARGSKDIEAVSGLFERLRSGPGGFLPGELDVWLDRLGKEGRWGQAYLIWVSQLPPERLATLGNVANGGFEFVPSQGGFDWRFQRIDGSRIDRVRGAGGGSEHSLRIAFEDRRVMFAHVFQYLVLPPGDYTLIGRMRSENLRTERGLVWTVKCADQAGEVLVDSPPLRGNGGWREFSKDFSVPATCGGQRLVLRLPARIPAEQRIGGRVWFDDIRIVRRDASN